MTEMQIAQQIFSRPASSDATMSLITGIALTSVTDGFAEVDIEGFTATADGSLMLPSLESGISIGDNVAVALYGPPEGPKKALILGVIGAEGGGSIEELEARMRAAEADIDQLQALTSSQGTAITGLQSTVSSHTTSISNLGSRMTTAEGDIDSLETRMGTAEDDIDALETTTSSQGTAITGLQSTVSSHTTSISNLGSRMTTAEGDIDSLETRVTALEQGGSLPALEQRVTNLEGRVDTAEDDIDALETTTASQGTAITGLQSTVSSHTTSISNLGSRMTTAEGDIDSLETRMGTAEDDIDALETTTSSQGSRITTLENQWGLHVISTLSEGSQITGKGVYEFNSIGGTLASRWSGGNVGDYSAICFDYAADGYAVLLCTSPRSNTLWIIKKWAGQFDYVRAI